jgi:hypothetical protein
VGHEILSQDEDWCIRLTDSDPDETALNEVVVFCGAQHQLVPERGQSSNS